MCPTLAIHDFLTLFHMIYTRGGWQDVTFFFFGTQVITVSQLGVPLEAVKEVGAGFGRAVGTSRLATKSQVTSRSAKNNL